MCEVEVMKSEMTESQVTVEGEFVSQATMESWGWSERLNVINPECFESFFIP